MRPRVVIIGGGFAGLHAARALRAAPVDVTLVDRTNHHVFQPLLYQVANTSLAPSDIAAPIRWILRSQRNVTVLLGDVIGVAPAARTVEVAGQGTIGYDALIIATGARHAYFGHDQWEMHAPGLKTLEDALDMRQRMLLAFERAEWEADEAARRALLTFVIVGGGPTGVELAGTLPEFARVALRPDFRRFDAGAAHVMLIEGGPRLLPSFPERVSATARRDLERLGVEVVTGKLVTEVSAAGVTMGAEHVAARTVFWAAGNVASPLGRALGVPVDRAGRVLVADDLSVPGHPEICIAGGGMPTDGSPASRRQRCRWGAWPGATRRGDSAALPPSRFAISTRESWRRSDETRPWQSSASTSPSPAGRRGSSGSSSTSCISWASATG